MVHFLSINFCCWISSIFVGFFKSSRYFVSLCTCNLKNKDGVIRTENVYQIYVLKMPSFYVTFVYP